MADPAPAAPRVRNQLGLAASVLLAAAVAAVGTLLYLAATSITF